MGRYLRMWEIAPLTQTSKVVILKMYIKKNVYVTGRIVC